MKFEVGDYIQCSIGCPCNRQGVIKEIDHRYKVYIIKNEPYGESATIQFDQAILHQKALNFKTVKKYLEIK